MTEYNIKKSVTELKTLVLISTISYILGVHTLAIYAQETPISQKEHISNAKVTCYATTQLLSSLTNLEEGALVKTAGFYAPGDGGQCSISDPEAQRRITAKRGRCNCPKK